MGPADSLSSRPGKSLWIVKCLERFWYFPGSFDRASFRLCMTVSFVEDSPLSPPPFRMWKGKTSGQSPFICFLGCLRSFFGFACGEGSAAGWFLPYHLRKAFSLVQIQMFSFACRPCSACGAAACMFFAAWPFF